MTNCPLCGGGQRRKLYALQSDEGVDYATVRCLDCGFVHMWPRPSEDYLTRFYTNAPVYAQPSERPEDYANAIADKQCMLGGFLKTLPDAPATGLAVDYGAGQGATVKALANMGFDATGVEISAKARDAAKALFGVTLRDGDISDFHDNSVALLTMFDILEHLLEPADFLSKAHTKLQAGGAILIGVPNYDAIDRILTGPRSKALIFPEHVNQFTRATLTKALSDAGFTVRYVGSPPPYGVAITLKLRQALLKTFGRNAVTHKLRDGLVWIKRYLVYPLPNAFVEKSGLFGQSLLILAQKRA